LVAGAIAASQWQAGFEHARHRQAGNGDRTPDLHAGNIAAVKDLLAAVEEDRQPICSAYDARAAIEMIVGRAGISNASAGRSLCR
jgi:hypothetical protein